MAAFAWTDAKVTVNAVDLSDHVTSCQVTHNGEVLDTTAMGSTSRTKLSGLKDWSIDVEWNQDHAASEVDATLFPLVGSTAFAISVVPVNTTVSATNPDFNGNALLPTYSFGGAVGEVAKATTTFEGTGALARGTGA